MTTNTINFMEPSPGGKVPLHEVALQLHPQDHVAIAKTGLQPGTVLILEDKE